MVIYHIAFAEDWGQAGRVGEYRISTRGQTLEQQGFIHASDAHQVAGVANRFYEADDGLIVLVIDTDRLRSLVRYESVPGSDGCPGSTCQTSPVSCPSTSIFSDRSQVLPSSLERWTTPP